MVKLDLADRLDLIPKDQGLDLTVTGSSDLPEDDNNLAVRAARLFYRAAGIRPGVEILLDKRIPIAAGLGGGSSDAAAVLKGLNRLYGFPLDQNQLLELGGALGADVPFFIIPEVAALAQGIGDEFLPAPDLPKMHFLLINPGWPLSTAQVYENYKLVLTTTNKSLINSQLSGGSFIIDQVLHNDLESVVLPRYPEVQAIKDRLVAEGAAGALMTGSGPTVFGVFLEKRQAENASRKIRESGREEWLIILTRNLNDSPSLPV